MGILSKLASPNVKNCFHIVIICVGSWIILQKIKKVGSEYIVSRNKKKMIDQWKHDGKWINSDVVILHQFPPGKSIPNPSGFALKLETFLRMANIQYHVDTECPKSIEKDKSPWITLQGENFTDSQLIIEMLEKKYEKSMDNNYSPEERAVGTMARLMVEEHLYWGLILWRYVYSEGKYLNELFSYSEKDLEAFKKLCKPKYSKFTFYQGLGRHSEKEVIELMCKDLKTLSLILGNKKYLLGDKPVSDDCAVFGMIAQVIWADLNSPYEKLINEELLNLKNYAIRMKETFWPDWDRALAK